MAFIDVEASGLATGSFPVEVAVAIPHGSPNGSWVIDVQSRIIRPAATWLADPSLWAPAAEALHGLSRARLEAEGEDVASIAAWLDRVLIGATVLSDTGGRGSDAGWLSAIGSAVGDPWWPTRWRLNDWPTATHIDARAKAASCSGMMMRMIWDAAPPHTHAAGEDALRQAWVWVEAGSASAVPADIAPSSRFRRRW